jgi:hypothetical protein
MVGMRRKETAQPLSSRVLFHPATWEEAMLVPKGFEEREKHPRAMRWPKDIAAEVEKIAKENRQDFSATAFHLLDWALAEYKRQKGELKATGS